MHLSPVTRALACLATLCSFALSLGAAVKPAAIFGDHMVLQQDSRLRVWGKAAPNEPVSVALTGAGIVRGGKSVADATGDWMVALDPVDAAKGACELTIAGPANRVVLRDVLIGDVWVASGQSNMAFLMRTSAAAATELPRADLPTLRLFRVTPTVSITPSDEVQGRWVECTPATAALFSAVAYHFGKELSTHLGRPVGLIGTYWGGTPAQAWMSEPALAANPLFGDHLARKKSIVDTLDERMKRYNDVVIPKWESDVAAWKTKRATNPSSTPATEPRKPTSPDRNPGVSTVLYNAMIHPLGRYAIKGVIWYQGESNASSPSAAKEYAELFPALIRDWRALWKRDDLPFLFVQLPGYGGGENFAELRASQAATLALPHTGMAVAIDLGDLDNIHPTNKREVGHRLALVARSVVYGENVNATGPIPAFATITSSGGTPNIRIRFDYTQGNLIARSGIPTAFEIIDQAGGRHPAEAAVQGDTVILSVPADTKPKAVSYAWSPFPSANLYGQDGLPAAPFTMKIESR